MVGDTDLKQNKNSAEYRHKSKSEHDSFESTNRFPNAFSQYDIMEMELMRSGPFNRPVTHGIHASSAQILNSYNEL